MKRTVKGNRYVKQPYEVEVELPLFRCSRRAHDRECGTWFHFREDGTVFCIVKNEHTFEIVDNNGSVDDYTEEMLTDKDGDYTCTREEFNRMCAEVMVFLSRGFL